jgi:hypothetical protein
MDAPKVDECGGWVGVLIRTACGRPTLHKIQQVSPSSSEHLHPSD